MRVKAMRLGWNEKLTPEQEGDLDPYDYTSNELEGELEEFTIPATNEHNEIKVCLVNGQEADPSTVQPIRVDNALSHDDIRSRLSKAVRESLQLGSPNIVGKDLPSAWVAEVYDKAFVYEYEGKYYKRSYSVDKKTSVVTLGDDAVEVVRKTDYVALNSEGCGCGPKCGCDPCKAKHGKSKFILRKHVITGNESMRLKDSVVNAKKSSKSKGSKGGANCGVGPGGFQPGNKCAVGLGRGAVGKSPAGHKKGAGKSKAASKSKADPYMDLRKPAKMPKTGPGGAKPVAKSKPAAKTKGKKFNSSPKPKPAAKTSTKQIKDDTALQSRNSLIKDFKFQKAYSGDSNPYSPTQVLRASTNVKKNHESLVSHLKDAANGWTMDNTGLLDTHEAYRKGSVRIVVSKKPFESHTGKEFHFVSIYGPKKAKRSDRPYYD